MAGKITNVNGDLQAWREARLQEYPLENGGNVKLRTVDMLALMNEDGNVPNPLMAIIVEHTDTRKKKDAQQASEDVMATPEQRTMLREELNRVMIAVVAWPPLKEQGYEDGIGVDEFSTGEKMDIFIFLLGGKRLDNAVNFRPEPPGGLVAALDGAELWDEAEPASEFERMADVSVDGGSGR